ncbi:hypothetical protein BDY17DRAFT_326090 [Neohortaea acidophila]|uniref:Uncharacterized protein n=1 Tax=Neohortaea acidophila TaxID=245834 RepID=A0A6A6PNM4_9PEZI|nr:uncharacterized protein BDY17DRAFT_326090 [Neohortaea acidophila]KAF2481396.1 hypothetical protein BDY17DRAFT_326090 [Neohortaea acidophila]
MPGIQPSPGMRDVDVCYGAYQAGSEGVQSALQKARWKYNHQPVRKTGDLDRKRYSDIISPVEPSEAQDEPNSPSSPSAPHDFEPVSPTSVPPIALDQKESGLPPTPPNALALDEEPELQNGHDMTPPPIFADGVRNALRSEQSRTPIKQQASPLTPDPSPPRKSSGARLPLAVQSEEIAQADSLPTAHENQTLLASETLTPVHLPEEDRLPQHWLDTTRELQAASIGLGAITVEETPVIAGDSQDASASGKLSPQASTPDKQRSQPGKPDGVEYSPPPDTSIGQEAKGLGLSGAPSLQDNAQERNNLVYKKIQEDNVKRHSAVSATSGAIPVGIVMPALDLTPKTLKRQAKSYSLRGDLSNGSHRNSGDSTGSELVWRPKKLRTPEKNGVLDSSPILESKYRQVSSPAKLGADASDMTALTFASMQGSPSATRTRTQQPEVAHKLRHVSPGDRLSNNMSVRRTSLEVSPPPEARPYTESSKADRRTQSVSDVGKRAIESLATERGKVPGVRSGSQPLHIPKQRSKAQPSPDGASTAVRLRHFSHEARLENNDDVRRTSLGHATRSHTQTERPIDPPGGFEREFHPATPRKSLDARHLYPTTTPMSISQISDRTDNIEIGEANGVRLYAHNNESLMVVQHHSRPTSKGKEFEPDSSGFVHGGYVGLRDPVFVAQVEPPTPTLATTRPEHQVDSPLTNPRAAPVPPIFKVIPPTPVRELLERHESSTQQEDATTGRERSPSRKRLSLGQRARRYSDIIFPGLGSLRRSSQRFSVTERDTYLSPMWKPQGFWDDIDSDEDYDDFEAGGSLPRGGDTSDVTERRLVFPRAMSKRLPGFRGAGGFLVGNSLGIDRHGSNNRRHYVGTSTRTLSARQSQELMKSLSSPREGSQELPIRSVVRAQRHFVIPFTGGSRAYWVGTGRLRAKVRALRLAREERERERRREKIRKSIGHRVYHDQ